MQELLPLSERDKICLSCPLPAGRCNGGDANCPWGRARAKARQRPSLVEERCQRIMGILRREKVIRSAALEERLGFLAYAYLRRLRERGLVVLVGATRSAVWELADG